VALWLFIQLLTELSYFRNSLVCSYAWQGQNPYSSFTRDLRELPSVQWSRENHTHKVARLQCKASLLLLPTWEEALSIKHAVAMNYCCWKGESEEFSFLDYLSDIQIHVPVAYGRT
jgi:hypothetical protein